MLFKFLSASRVQFAASWLLVVSAAMVAGGQTITPVTGQLEVNWKEGSVALKAKLLAESRSQYLHLVANKKGQPAGVGLKLSRAGDELTIRGSSDDLLKNLQPGTRGLWLGHRADKPRYRIDLPPVVLSAVQAGPASGDQLVLELVATGLLPGFDLMGGIENAGGTPAKARPMRKEYISVARRDNKDIVTLRLPARSGQERSYRLSLTNRDGTSSLANVAHSVGPTLTRTEPAAQPGATSPPSIPVPTAPDQVVKANAPDLVRVPEATGPVESALTQLSLQALRAAPGAKLLASDRVVKLQPAAGTWVSPGSAIDLTIERKVPDLKGSVASARSRLKVYELDEGLPSGFRDDDMVVSQQPAAGTYVPRSTAIAMELRRQVPNVAGKLVEQAQRALKERGFAALYYADWKSRDTIQIQKPEANQLVPLGTEVELTLVRRVPPVEKQRLNPAIQEIEGGGFRFVINVEGGVDRERAFVAEQSPAANRSILLPPKFRDHDQLLVTLTPGSQIPQLLEEALGDAERRLRELRLRPSVAGGADERWPLVVSGHSYSVGDIVAFGTTVTLNVQVQTVEIPRIVGKPIRVAAGMLDEVGLRPYVGFDTFAEVDFVAAATMLDTANAPPVSPGQALPGSQIKLTIARQVPAVEGLSVERAADVLERFKIGVSSVGAGGFIAQQAPRGGFINPERDGVRLVLGNPLPRVVGLDVEGARAALVERGFENILSRQIRVATVNPGLLGPPVVLDQAPRAGQIWPLDAPVNLTFRSFYLIDWPVPGPNFPPPGDDGIGGPKFNGGFF